MTQQEIADSVLSEIIEDGRSLVLGILRGRPHTETAPLVAAFSHRTREYVHLYGGMTSQGKLQELADLILDVDKIIQEIQERN